METKLVKINNRVGLHARPAASFVKLARNFESEIILKKDSKEANGKSIIGIMALGAQSGDEIEVCATGDDAKDAIEQLAEFLENLDD